MVTETLGDPQGVAPGGAASQLPHLQLLPSVSKKKEASVSTHSRWRWAQPALQTPDNNTELGKSNGKSDIHPGSFTNPPANAPAHGVLWACF